MNQSTDESSPLRHDYSSEPAQTAYRVIWEGDDSQYQMRRGVRLADLVREIVQDYSADYERLEGRDVAICEGSRVVAVVRSTGDGTAAVEWIGRSDRPTNVGPIVPAVETAYSEMVAAAEEGVFLDVEQTKLERALAELETTMLASTKRRAAARVGLARSIIEASSRALPGHLEWHFGVVAPWVIRSGSRIFAAVQSGDMPDSFDQALHEVAFTIIDLDQVGGL